MRELSQAEMIERGDDYFEIADAIHPFGDWRLRSTGKVLRLAARHLLRGDGSAYRAVREQVQQHKRYFVELEGDLKDRLRDYVGSEVWALIEKHLVARRRYTGHRRRRETRSTVFAARPSP